MTESTAPRLAPFWYTPEGQDEGASVSFRLRPLTQPEMVDVEEHYVDGRPTSRAHYEAGRIGIIGTRGVKHPQTGAEPILPQAFAWLPRTWVALCGMRLIAEDLGLDWGTLIDTGAGADEDPGKN